MCFSQQAIHEQALVQTDNKTQLTDAKIGSESYVTYQAIMTVFCYWFKSRVMRHHSELWSPGVLVGGRGLVMRLHQAAKWTAKLIL